MGDLATTPSSCLTSTVDESPDALSCDVISKSADLGVWGALGEVVVPSGALGEVVVPSGALGAGSTADDLLDGKSDPAIGAAGKV